MGSQAKNWHVQTILEKFVTPYSQNFTYFGVVDVDVDRILEGQVVRIAIIGEGHDFDVGVVKRRKGQFGAVGGEPHGFVAAENLLCDQKRVVFFARCDNK